MVSIITGDIINSRNSMPKVWLTALKNALSRVGGRSWEIFRGDSFQLEVTPEDALIHSIYLKASIKALKNTDVRLAIGIGEKKFSGSKITESNGQAFIFSGEKLDELKEERSNLAIRSPWDDFNYEINVSIRLALIAMDNWSPISAELVKLSIENAGITQKDLADLAKRSQSTVSEALKRARLNDIMELDRLYRKKLSRLIDA
jgi:hypothetical protein